MRSTRSSPGTSVTPSAAAASAAVSVICSVQPPTSGEVSQPGGVGAQVFGTGRPAPGCMQLPPGPVTQTNVGDGWVGSVVGTPEPGVDGCGAGDVDSCGAGDAGGC